MTVTAKFAIAFYTLGLIIALRMGFKYGFTDTHTMPQPFFVEGCVFFIGISISILLLNEKTKQDKLVHLIGLGVNGLLVIYMLSQ